MTILKEIAASVLSVISFPAFAVEDAELVHQTRSVILEKLEVLLLAFKRLLNTQRMKEKKHVSFTLIVSYQNVSDNEFFGPYNFLMFFFENVSNEQHFKTQASYCGGKTQLIPECAAYEIALTNNNVYSIFSFFTKKYRQ